jgi:hypothetical protein
MVSATAPQSFPFHIDLNTREITLQKVGEHPNLLTGFKFNLSVHTVALLSPLQMQKLINILFDSYFPIHSNSVFPVFTPFK